MSNDTKHSGPVDVLAVLDEAQDWLYRSSESKGDDARAEAVKQVRAAVAELIEAANYAYPPGDYSQDAHGYAVRSALDRVGGAK